MTTESREKIHDDYSKSGENYDDVRLVDPRGRLLSEHDLNITNKMFDMLPKGEVVEIGAGTGRFTVLMLDKGYKVLATDINEAMLKVLRQKVEDMDKQEQCEVRSEDVFKLSMPDNQYDLAVCLHVIPRFLTLEDQKAALAEICRVIKPGGQLLMNYRNSKSPLKLLYSSHAASPQEIEGHLREHGMTVTTRRGKWLLTRSLLNRTPLFVGRIVAAVDKLLERFWTGRAWDVFLIAKKQA